MIATAAASGTDSRMTSKSERVSTGRRDTFFHISSSKKPSCSGTRRTWKAFVPISESAMFSLT